MSQKELGLAVIGSGRIGSLRAILASGHPAVNYLGVSDINIENAKKLAAKSHAQKFTDDNHELISDPNVNVVIVSTSEHEHFDSVMHALELGKPVLVEKPIALSVDEADKMIKKSEETGTLFRVGYAQRFKRRYLSGKDQLLEGRRPRERNVRGQPAELLGKEARESPVEYKARFRSDALQCVEGASRFDGHRNLAALHAELVHEIGARLGHFHFECSARQLRVHGEAAFAEVTARAVSLGPRKAVLVTRSRR